jgi:Arm DNA-binding domain
MFSDGKIGQGTANSLFDEELPMLTDLKLKKLKLKDKSYKIADRDGMYAFVTNTGQITFRYDYRLNGRRETLTIGRYGDDGMTLSIARERCAAARKMVAEGGVPST